MKAFAFSLKTILMLTLTTTGLLAWQTKAHAATKTVCTVTINSDNERRTMQQSLAGQDIKFVELTDYDNRYTGNDRAKSQWMQKACDAGVQCDVLLVSAHFGGVYFGSTGFEMFVQPTQELSCAKSCDGILKHPKEVFLMGCNTLAEKNRDARTQQQYAAVLAEEHQMDRGMAERVAETRYGAVGSTFKDQAKRIFAGVPRIYGFSSVSPSGAHVQPLLRNYFQSIPDYSAHLDQIDANSGDNVDLARALANTSFSQTSGVGALPNDPGVPYRNQICALFDRTKAIPDRTNVAVKMMTGTDRFIFLNTVVEFLNSTLELIKQDYWAFNSFQKIAKDQETTAALDKLKAADSTSLSLRLDLMDFDVQIGRATRADFNRNAVEALRPLLRQMNQVNADTICSAIANHRLRIWVTADDFAEGGLAKRSALTVAKCILTKDERITEAIIGQYTDMSQTNHYNGDDLRSLLLALTNLPGQNEWRTQIALGVLKLGAAFAPYSYGLVAAADLNGRNFQSAKLLSTLDIHQAALVYEVYSHLPRQEALGANLLASINRSNGEENLRNQLFAIVHLLPASSGYWSQVASEIANLDPGAQAVFLGEITDLQQIPPAIVDLSIRLLGQNKSMQVYPAYVLSKSHLNADQAARLYEVVKQDPMKNAGALARWVLSQQPSDVISHDASRWIHGQVYGAACERYNGLLQCRNISVWLH